MALTTVNASAYKFTDNNLSEKGNALYLSLEDLANVFPTGRINFPLLNRSGSVSAVGSHWLGNCWGDTGYNGGYYINYTSDDRSFSVKKYTPSGMSFPNSLYYIYYTNNSSNPTAGSTISIP